MKKILKKTSGLLPFILSVVSAAIGFSFNFIISRLLGAEIYGELQYLLSLCSTASSFFCFGLTWFIIREAKNGKHGKYLMSNVLTIFFIICAYLTPIVFYILNRTSDLMNQTSTQFLIIGVAITMSINVLFSAYYQGIGKYHDSIIIENIIPKIVVLIITIVFLLLGNLEYFAKNYLLFYLIIYGSVSVILFKKFFKKLTMNLGKKDFLSISFFFGVTITYSLTSQLTKVFQGAFYQDKTVLGIISASLTLIDLISIITGVVTKLIQPVFAKLKRENNFDGLLEAYRLSTRLCCYFGIPFYTFLLLQGDRFLIWFGDSYLAYPFIIVILAITNMISTLTGPTGTMLSMTGKEKIELFNGIINIGVFSIGCFIFSYDPIYGFCLALLCSTVVVNVIKYCEVWVIYKRSPLNFKTIVGALIILIVNVPVIYFLGYISNYWVWFFVSLFSGMTIICLNFIIGLHKQDFKKMMALTKI